MPYSPIANGATSPATPGAAFAGFRGAILGVSVISGIINVLALTGSLYMLQVYDRVLSSHSVPTLIALSFLMIVLYAFHGTLDMLRSQASSHAAALFDRRMARPVHFAVLNLPLQGASRSLAQQPMRDVDAIRHFLANGGPVAFLDLPWMPVYLAFVFVLHPLLGLVCLAGMLMLVMLTLLTEWLTQKDALAATRADAARHGIADTQARNAEVLKAMGLEDRAAQRFDAANRSYLAVQTRSSQLIARLTSVSRFMRLTLQSGMLGLGAYLTVRGEITSGAIIAASITTSRALAPIEQVIAHWRPFLAARQSLRRLSETLRNLPLLDPPFALPAPTQRLSLENATLCAPGTQCLVLSNISFELRAGQALAIIGPSAAGKSSLARAICGVWPLKQGCIRLDGAEINHWSSKQLGQHIGYLPQDVTLFDGTIADNIGRMEDEKDSMAIIAAAKAAGIHDMILRLPNGYETDVGPDGSALSAGQRQRLALARALFRDPFLVVLDEPNSNLDSDGEESLTTAIQGIRDRHGIAVVVAHRPSALNAVDLVAVINAGQLTAFGPKEDVLRKVLRQPLRTAVG
ncbi:type I secretion system permease/ATPase [Bradyrhizobium sp. HKCCYLS2038]|uniref:type I secretion system permease/ATPase n=1 Tax=unclassified Bradyrhizobium TaxID=2631580 RepID=UPI003EB92A1B